MRAAYDSLPESHRYVLALARSGHSYRDIAGIIGVTPPMVSRWAMHALMSLGQASRSARTS